MPKCGAPAGEPGSIEARRHAGPVQCDASSKLSQLNYPPGANTYITPYEAYTSIDACELLPFPSGKDVSQKRKDKII